MTKTKEKVEYSLTSRDRCDRCQSQAYVKAEGVNGELLFCGHHFAKVESTIGQWAYKIIDERERLVEDKLKGSAN
jgi:hypothetical protein